MYGGYCTDCHGDNLKLLEYEPDTSSWTVIELSTAAGSVETPPRFGHGFAAAAGRLYVLGGSSSTGRISSCTPPRVAFENQILIP